MRVCISVKASIDCCLEENMLYSGSTTCIDSLKNGTVNESDVHIATIHNCLFKACLTNFGSQRDMKTCVSMKDE